MSKACCCKRVGVVKLEKIFILFVVMMPYLRLQVPPICSVFPFV